MECKYILKIFVYIIIFWGFTTGISFAFHHVKENMTNMNIGKSILKKEDAFCEHYKGRSGELNEECGKLTQKNCLSTSCCGWASPGKCVAGGKDGPTYNTDDNGKTNTLDYYFHSTFNVY